MKRIVLVLSTALLGYQVSEAQNVGVDENTPLQKLDVKGAIRLQNANNGVGQTGSIRWNGTNFQLWDPNVSGWVNFGFGTATVQTVTDGLGLLNVGTSTNPILDVRVDGSSLEINADVLQVRNGGISTLKIADNAVTVAKLADGLPNQVLRTDGSGNPLWQNLSTLNGSLAGDGLVFDGTNSELDVEVDGATIQIGTLAPNVNKLLVPANGITAVQIAAGAVGSSEILNGSILPEDISAAAPAAVGQVLSITTGPSVAWVDPSSLSTVLRDADADTKIQVETAPDEDRIRFYTGPTVGGTQRMIIDNTGNVGIGPSSMTAAQRLHIEVSQASGLNFPLLIRNTGAQNNVEAGSGIGFNNINSSAAPQAAIYNERLVDAFGGKLHFLVTNANNTTPVSLADARMTILSDGNVGIGNVSPTYKLQVNGKVKSNGINETSDARLKKNVSNIDNALQMVMSLNGKTYNWRTDEFPEMSFNSGRQYGFIAQEVEKIIPEVVGTDNEGWKSIEYSHLVPVLLEAIKEQQAMIASLKKENTEYSDALNTLKAEVSKNASLINVLLEQSAPASSMKQ